MLPSADTEGAARIRRNVRVEGVVQGVGFRPFVHSLATELGLTGVVGNDVDGVFASAEGDQETKVDADRIAATGAPAYQINTGTGCRLDASMLRTPSAT
jgi:hydrogenase maturation protein HypF